MALDRTLKFLSQFIFYLMINDLPNELRKSNMWCLWGVKNMLLLKLSRTVCGWVCNFTLVSVTSNLTGIFFFYC